MSEEDQNLNRTNRPDLEPSRITSRSSEAQFRGAHRDDLTDEEKDELFAPMPNQCEVCVHRFEVGRGNGGRCNAFPEGIPEEIATNEVDHLLPYPGDHNVRFTPTPDAPTKYKRRYLEHHENG